MGDSNASYNLFGSPVSSFSEKVASGVDLISQKSSKAISKALSSYEHTKSTHKSKNRRSMNTTKTAEGILKHVSQLRQENSTLRSENIDLRHELSSLKNRIKSFIDSRELDAFERGVIDNMTDTASTKSAVTLIIHSISDLNDEICGEDEIDLDEFQDKLKEITEQIQGMTVKIVTANASLIDNCEALLTAVSILEDGDESDDEESTSVGSMNDSSPSMKSQPIPSDLSMPPPPVRCLSSEGIPSNAPSSPSISTRTQNFVPRPFRHDLEKMTVKMEMFKNRLKSFQNLTTSDSYTRMDFDEDFHGEDRKFNERSEKPRRKRDLDDDVYDKPEIYGFVVKGHIIKKRVWFRIAMHSNEPSRRIFVERRLEHFRELYRILKDDFHSYGRKTVCVPHLKYIKTATLWDPSFRVQGMNDLTAWLQALNEIREIREHASYQTFVRHAIDAWRVYRDIALDKK